MENQSIKNNDAVENLLHDTFDSKKEYSDIDSWKHIKQKMFKQYFFRFNPARLNIFYVVAATAALSASMYLFSPEQKNEPTVQTTSSAEKATTFRTNENTAYQPERASLSQRPDSAKQASTVSTPVKKTERQYFTTKKTNGGQTAISKKENASKETKTDKLPAIQPVSESPTPPAIQKDSLISNSQHVQKALLPKDEDSTQNHKKVKKTVYIQKQPVIIKDTLRSQKKRRKASKRKQ